MRVVDANVATKWFVPELGSDIASEYLRAKDALIAPSVIRLEVLGAILKCVRTERTSSQQAEQYCKQWLSELEERAIVIFDEHLLISNAIKLSLKLKHHLVDCFYLALCNLTEAPLVTFDIELARKAKQVGVRCELLKED